LLAVAGIAITLLQTGSAGLLFTNAGINLLTCLVLLLFLKLYFLLKEKKNENIINKKIGAGDIYFLIACCFFFSPISFCIFLASSLVFSLLITLFIFIISNPSEKKDSIPLAGLQSLF